MSTHGSREVPVNTFGSKRWVWASEPGEDWQPIVTSTYVESGGERLVLDPLVPKTAATELWKPLDTRPPTIAAVLIPDHVRDNRRVCPPLPCPSLRSEALLSRRCPQDHSGDNRNQIECFPEVLSPFTTGEGALRHPSGCPSNG